MQLSRLFNFLGSFQIEYIYIFYLSGFLIPNLINTIIPFILIFGLIITFIKLDKDKELIAIYSLGLSIKEIIKPLIIFSFLIILFYIFLNLIFSPYVYDIYKKKEFDLRNNIDIQNLNISNFTELDKNLILDFNKKNDKFTNVFIKYIDENNLENILYSKKAKIEKKNNNFIFNLNNGFKVTFNNNQNEKLDFESYKFIFPSLKDKIYNNFDKNSLTIFEIIDKKYYNIIIEKIFETFLTISIIILFYYYILKKNNFKLNRIFYFILISISTLIILNILKNVELKNQINIIVNFLNIMIIYLFIILSNLNDAK